MRIKAGPTPRGKDAKCGLAWKALDRAAMRSAFVSVAHTARHGGSRLSRQHLESHAGHPKMVTHQRTLRLLSKMSLQTFV